MKIMLGESIETSMGTWVKHEVEVDHSDVLGFLAEHNLDPDKLTWKLEYLVQYFLAALLLGKWRRTYAGDSEETAVVFAQTMSDLKQQIFAALAS